MFGGVQMIGFSLRTIYVVFPKYYIWREMMIQMENTYFDLTKRSHKNITLLEKHVLFHNIKILTNRELTYVLWCQASTKHLMLLSINS